MTIVEMLASVEAQIRKDIPRLMELREGCIIKNNHNGDLEIFLGYISIDGFSRVVLKDLYIKSIRIDIEGNLIIDEFDKYAYSIIGHEIMLSDVLEWLFTSTLISYYISSSGEILYWLIEGAPETRINIYWDLSSPYLKDQSEELIKFLYNIKINK